MHCIYEITHTIYHITHMTTQKIHLPSHPLYLTLHPLYLCHQTQCINWITHTLSMSLHTICMTSHSLCLRSHEHLMTSHLYRYDITWSIFMTSYPIYMISSILFHENKMTIPGISPTVFDSHCICVVTPTLSMPSQQLWKSSQLHMYDLIHTIQHIRHRLYDIKHQD